MKNKVCISRNRLGSTRQCLKKSKEMASVQSHRSGCFVSKYFHVSINQFRGNHAHLDTAVQQRSD